MGLQIHTNKFQGETLKRFFARGICQRGALINLSYDGDRLRTQRLLKVSQRRPVALAIGTHQLCLRLTDKARVAELCQHAEQVIAMISVQRAAGVRGSSTSE